MAPATGDPGALLLPIPGPGEVPRRRRAGVLLPAPPEVDGGGGGGGAVAGSMTRSCTMGGGSIGRRSAGHGVEAGVRTAHILTHYERSAPFPPTPHILACFGSWRTMSSYILRRPRSGAASTAQPWNWAIVMGGGCPWVSSDGYAEGTPCVDPIEWDAEGGERRQRRWRWQRRRR